MVSGERQEHRQEVARAEGRAKARPYKGLRVMHFRLDKGKRTSGEWRVTSGEQEGEAYPYVSKALLNFVKILLDRWGTSVVG